MIFGFNTDVKVGPVVYHVQTEDRGAGNPVIDTTIYCKGHILHRRVNSYKDLLGTPEFNDASLRQRLEEQHRAIIDELRSGALTLELPEALQPPAGLQVQLLNPASWLKAGTASLQIEVKSKKAGKTAAGASVHVKLDGANGPVEFRAAADDAGRVDISFPMPRLGPGGTELVIHAKGPAGEDEIRYSLRPKSKPAS
ncbi:MAG TPA: hypothetical protein VGA40_00360 [Candidatus Acidoferrales bacterium]